MERSDEPLTTRDLAGGGDRRPEAEPEPAAPASGDVIAAEPAQEIEPAETERRPEPEQLPEPEAEPESHDQPAPLLDGGEEFQTRWEEIQVRFVDEPRGAVEDADALVANVMQRLAEGFAQERERLEAQWGRGEDISTEDLRVALQRYRAFFQRLLST